MRCRIHRRTDAAIGDLDRMRPPAGDFPAAAGLLGWVLEPTRGIGDRFGDPSREADALCELARGVHAPTRESLRRCGRPGSA